MFHSFLRKLILLSLVLFLLPPLLLSNLCHWTPPSHPTSKFLQSSLCPAPFSSGPSYYILVFSSFWYPPRLSIRLNTDWHNDPDSHCSFLKILQHHCSLVYTCIQRHLMLLPKPESLSWGACRKVDVGKTLCHVSQGSSKLLPVCVLKKFFPISWYCPSHSS